MGHIKGVNVDKSLCVKRTKNVCLDELQGGLDEVAFGSLAGRMYAAIVILPNHHNLDFLPVDSKQINEAKISEYAKRIREEAVFVNIGYVEEHAMNSPKVKREQLWRILVRGSRNYLKTDFPIMLDGGDSIRNTEKVTSVIKGDTKVDCISAAAIVAKEAFNTYMLEMDEKYPEYGFNKHKGYKKNQHVKAIQEHGLTPIHRKNARKMKNRKLKNETRQFSTDTLNAMLNEAVMYLNQNMNYANDWERNFIKEQIENLQLSIHPSEKVQYFIEKTLKSIKKNAKKQGKNIDIENIRKTFDEKKLSQKIDIKKDYTTKEVVDMFMELVPLIKQDKELVNDSQRSFCKTTLGLLKDKKTLTVEQKVGVYHLYVKAIRNYNKKLKENLIHA